MPDDHDNDVPFEGRTYLLLRDHLQDTGAEPLPAALPAWLSPDIMVRRPSGALGGDAEVGAINLVEVTVHNLGGIAAIGVFVDAFFASPSTGVTPATAALIGGNFVDVPSYGIATLPLPWVPAASYTGHGCILARASLIVPPDTYANPLIFDQRGDRHVAQRNIEVIDLPEDGNGVNFQFNVTNPTMEPLSTNIEVREVREQDDLRAVGATMGFNMPVIAPEPINAIGLTRGDGRMLPDENGKLREAEPVGVRGAKRRKVRPDILTRVLDFDLQPGEVAEANLHAKGNPDTPRGLMHVLEIRQTDAVGTLIGGLSVVLRN